MHLSQRPCHQYEKEHQWQLIVKECGWEGDNIITWAWAFAQGDNIGFIDGLFIKSQHELNVKVEQHICK